MADQYLSNLSVTWNSGATTFYAMKMNVTDTSSASASKLMEWQVGGAAKMAVDKSGNQTLTSSDAGATAGPTFTLYRDSASPAASDIMGKLLFQGEDSAGNTEDYSEIYSLLTDPTTTSEDASLLLRTKVAGTMTTRLTLGATGTTLTGVMLGGDGAVGAPAYSFSGDTDSGLYRIGGNNLGIALGGAGIVDLSVTTFTVTCANWNFGSYSATGASAGYQVASQRMDSSGTSTSGQTHRAFANPNGVVGTISVSGSTTAYNTSSDAELKASIESADPYSMVQAIKTVSARTYERKVNPGVKETGFVAQEMAQVFPEAVTPPTDPGDPWMMDYGKVTPVLWAGLQRVTERLELLDAYLGKPDPGDYREARKKAYIAISPEKDVLHSMGDTLDALMKQVEAIRSAAGVSRHPDFDARFAAIEAVKAAHPKPA